MITYHKIWYNTNKKKHCKDFHGSLNNRKLKGVPINKIVLSKQSTAQDTSAKQSSDDNSGTDEESAFSDTKTNFEVKINYMKFLYD